MFKRIALGLALAGLAGTAFAAPLTYRIDPNHTQVTATWTHFGFSHPFANFGQTDGTITYDPQNVGASSVKVTLPLAGLDTTVPALDEHLRSADFFDAETYPTITFTSTRVEKVDGSHARVTGDLTIRGITRPLTIDVALDKPADKASSQIGFRATGVIKRLAFNMSAGFPAISNDVDLIVTTEAQAQ